MIQKVSRGAILATAFVFYAAIAQAQQFAALVMDARTGQVLKAINADTRVHPASLTKMMTLYIVFDELQHGRLSLDQKITVSQHAASEPPSRLGLRAGQKIELRYLIRAAAIKSANDAATAMGEAVGGSEAGFAARMNAYARAMGMKNTTFKNANGLTREGHMTTARDMAILGRRLVYDFPQYYNIFGRTSTSAGLATVRNTNRRMLDGYPGADGIKTGYTKAAGFNLVSSAQRGNRRVIVALLGGKSTASRNAQSAQLMDFGFAQMPAFARVVPPAPLRTLVAFDPPAQPARVAGVPIAVAAAKPAAAVADAGATLALDASGRPMPRALDDEAITRNSATIAAAIAEVNSELGAAQATRNVPAGITDGRPMPRPPSRVADAAAASDVPMAVNSGAGSASTFAIGAVRPRPAPPADELPEPVAMASAGAGTTGGHDWGVQLGAFRAKGDAERQLLTTALKDVPELDGGLRRVEAARTQGVTVYRAQFVGLSQSEALGACSTLARLQADCLPLAPGILIVGPGGRGGCLPGACLAPRHDLEDGVAGLERLGVGLPEAADLPAAVDPHPEPGADRGERLADLRRGDLALAQRHPARGGGEIGHVFREVRAVGGSREQQAREARGVDHRRRPRLPGEILVVVGPHHHADRQIRREAVGGEHDQDRGVVAPGRDRHALRPRDLDRLEGGVAGGVALEHRDPGRGRQLERRGAGVDDDDPLDRKAAAQQLADRLGAAGAVAGDDDMIVQLAL